jgi:replicative DNA helicase
MGGARKGELWIVGGYMGEGKSQFLRGYAYHASTVQHKNVVYATLEMPFRDLLIQFAALHSTHPKFNNPFGIKATPIFNGSLSLDDKAKLKEVTEDYEKEDYGINYILQLPFNTTVASLREKLIYLNSIFPVDILMLDYTALLKPEFTRMNSIDATTEIANDLKLTALSFNNGEGLPIIAAHQVSREARNRAEEAEVQRYDRAFLATSSGIERAADIILWLLRTDDMVAQREVKMGINKFRRGKIMPDFILREYYDCSKLSSIQMEKEIVGDTTLID